MGGLMGSVDLPYVHIYRAKGKIFAYYRRGRRRLRLAGELGTPEFLKSYQAVHEAAEAEASPRKAAGRTEAVEGSLRALIEAYQAAPEFRQMKKSSQKGYLWVLEWLLPKYGDSRVATMPRDWVLRRRAELAQKTPGKANYFVTVLAAVFSWGIENGFCKVNPAARIKKLAKGASYRAWHDPEIEAFTSPPAGRMARPVLIALYTGQRQADIIKMPWSAYDGQFITLKQGKAGAEAEVMVIPVHPVLKVELDAGALDKTATTICTRADGHSWKQRHFAAVFAETRAKLGLAADVHFHGLRHTCASRLSEAGASDAMIQAITGHKTRQMVEHYTRGATRKKLATAGIAYFPAKKIGTKK